MPSIIIERGNSSFQLEFDQIIKYFPTFFCKKCNHNWIPNDRKFDKAPLHCPNCHDTYWFLSHEDLKKVKQRRFQIYRHSGKEIVEIKEQKSEEITDRHKGLTRWERRRQDEEEKSKEEIEVKENISNSEKPQSPKFERRLRPRKW